MSNENDNRYGSGKNLWRKVYGYNNPKPRVVVVIDTVAAVTYSLDLNKTLRHRDFFIIKDRTSGGDIEAVVIPPNLAEYDEGLINFSSIAESGSGNFHFTFSGTPYVVLTVESASLYGENLNVFGTALNTTAFNFSLSAPFTGSVRYRAIYSPTYPAYVTSAYTASITASAGSANPGGLDYYTASFAGLPGPTFKFLDTVWDLAGLNMGDVGLVTQTSSSNNATVEISSPGLDASIHFIAFYP